MRDADAGDATFLAEMLAEAAAWRPAEPRPDPAEVLERPGVGHYLTGWPRPGDVALVAEIGGERVGAAWYRLFPPDDPGYGFVAADVPEVAVAAVAHHRGRGVGRALVTALLARAGAEGHRALSLSVERANPARALYLDLGFAVVARDADTWTMVAATP